jgi:hypothetical protein
MFTVAQKGGLDNEQERSFLNLVRRQLSVTIDLFNNFSY